MTQPFAAQQGRNDPNDAVISESVALWGGVIATLVIGLPMVIVGIGQVLDVASRFVWLAIAGYFIGMTVQFWASQAYKDGLTSKELLKALLWPWDMYQTIREGVSWKSGMTSPVQDDDSPTLLDEKMALLVGVVLTMVFAVPMTIFAVFSVFGLLGSLVWMGVIVYLVGLFVQYWTSQAYKDGLTLGEVLETIVWPWATIKSIRDGVKARWQQRKPATS